MNDYMVNAKKAIQNIKSLLDTAGYVYADKGEFLTNNTAVNVYTISFEDMMNESVKELNNGTLYLNILYKHQITDDALLMDTINAISNTLGYWLDSTVGEKAAKFAELFRVENRWMDIENKMGVVLLYYRVTI